MNDETEDKSERSLRGLIWVWLCWVAVVVVLYILSSGPYMLMREKKVIRPNTLSSKFCNSVYSPLLWTYMNTDFWKPLGVYWHLWNPNDFDRAGKIHKAY